MDLTLTALAPEYERMFDLCKIDPKKREEVEHAITSILKNAPIYDSVSQFTNVPWWWIGLIHMRESSFDFRCHIHNGDPLTARTVHVPINRPVTGQPPFTWQESAIDALRFENLHKWQNWSIVGALFRLEAYNGFGYRKRGVVSPYVWSASMHYESGKFIDDGVFSPGAVDRQLGCGTVLRAMFDQDLVDFTVEKTTTA
jgi:lysozyme family protein